jgi:hypothetical protein
MAKKTWVNVGGVWKEVKNVWEKVDGVWVPKAIPKIKVSDEYRECIGYGNILYGIHDENKISAFTIDGELLWTQSFGVYGTNRLAFVFIDNIGRLIAMCQYYWYEINKLTGEIINSVYERFSTQSTYSYQSFGGVEVDENNNYLVSGCTKTNYAGMKLYSSDFELLWTAEIYMSGYSNPSMHAVFTENYILGGTSPTTERVYRYNRDGTYVNLLTSLPGASGGVYCAGGDIESGFALFGVSGDNPYTYKISEDLGVIFYVLATGSFAPKLLQHFNQTGKWFVSSAMKEISIVDGSLSGSLNSESYSQIAFDASAQRYIVPKRDTTNSILYFNHYDLDLNFIESITADEYLFFCPLTGNYLRDVIVVDNS